ncbi:non-ribosomal peptide synthetase [Hazenella coriacea]|uniref:Amino acid adenylation domain-containing protein n=1 Tax=Hazenella coriacea TaxID=1179467 RepID=A0A4R3L1N4_9BACL|nr:non-ribosomal peptide synthetase [Hazenella coriacea]TCS92395.1 amino acid adenylation domain-containing protein [Hazenella coriacea]
MTTPMTPQGLSTSDVYLLPSSYAQQRMWFFDQLMPDQPIYNISYLIEFEGALDLTVLEKSICHLMMRHEVLRTEFIRVGDELKQRVLPPPHSFSTPITNLMAEQDPRQAAFSQIQQKAQQPFDLSKAPLFRTHLYQIHHHSHYLLVQFHHIIFDLWSMGVFEQELLTSYRSFSIGQEPDLPELSIQYADFAHWQREWLQGEILEEQLSFWKEKLKGELPVIQLPTDRPRAASQSYQGNKWSFALPKVLSKQIIRLAQEEKVTPFILLLTAFKVLLSRYTDQKDIIVGTPVANRDEEELENLIGFFVNTLVLRTDCSGEPSFRELLKRVGQVVLDSYEHKDLPFERLVEEIQPERDMSYNPLFQVVFSYENKIPVELELPELTVRYHEIDNHTSKFDLGLFLYTQGEHLKGQFEYSSDLFDPETIERMTGQLESLLQGIVEHPDQSIARLPLLSEAEQDHLLLKMNQTDIDFPREKTVPQLFQEQVQQTPHAIALYYEDQAFTYEELYFSSLQLARKLKRRGVQRGTKVALCVDRSIEMIIGILGIMQAGGTYIPLDPAHPSERISFILEDAKVEWILTKASVRHDLPSTKANIFCMDQQSEEIVTEEELPVFLSTDPAYVIYTSGSTGKPKGVVVSHRALVNHITWMKTTFPLTETDRILQNVTYSFDPSLTEIFSALLSGAGLVVMKPGGHLDLDYLVDCLKKYQITRLQAFHSILDILLKRKDFLEETYLTHVFTGGELLPVELRERFLEKMSIPLINLYGPTEACIVTTYWDCREKLISPTIPIGRPVSNTEIYVLDQHQQPVPMGVAGELYIAGDCLAEGYLDRPELTKEKFVPHFLDSATSFKMYRTGDLVRWLPDGNLQFLGRIDNQVKIRGMRIELGEIQSVLESFSEVKEAIVQVQKTSDGSSQLVSYLVPQIQGELNISEIQKRIKERLPEYMVPKYCIQIDRIPITINGKVDVQALPTLTFQESNTYVAPRTQLELKIAQVWEKVLKIQRIGVTDNFFSIGGHSLKAVEMIGELKKELGIHVTLPTLFYHQTIAELALFLEKDEVHPHHGVIPIQIGQGTTTPLFLIHPGGGGALCYIHLAKSLGNDFTVYGIEAMGFDHGEVPLSDLHAMAQLYVKWIQEVQPEGPYRLAGWSLGGTIAFEMARLLEEEGVKVDFVGLLDAHGFDSMDPPKESRKPSLISWANLLDIDEEEILSLSEVEQKELILQRAQERSILPSSATTETVQRHLAVMESNRVAADQYHCSSPIRSDLYLFRVDEIAEKNPVDLVDRGVWQQRTQGELHVYEITGNHHNLVDPPHVEVLAQQLKKIL